MGHIDGLRIENVRLVSSLDQMLLLLVDRLDLRAGLVHGLVGSNLSGRSALLRFIGGGSVAAAVPSGRERATVSWSDAASPAALNTSRHCVYLGPIAYDSLSTLTSTVEEELVLHRDAAFEGPAVQASTEADFLIAAFGLDKCMSQNPMSLSGGQAAALSLVCALEMRRPVLCVDEVLAHLDINLRPYAWGALRQFARTGTIVLVADNQYDLMAEFADLAIILRKNRVDSVTQMRAAFTELDFRDQGIVPPATRLALEVWPGAIDAPITYDSLLGRVRRAVGG